MMFIDTPGGEQYMNNEQMDCEPFTRLSEFSNVCFFSVCRAICIIYPSYVYVCVYEFVGIFVSVVLVFCLSMCACMCVCVCCLPCLYKIYIIHTAIVSMCSESHKANNIELIAYRHDALFTALCNMPMHRHRRMLSRLYARM